MAYSRGCPDQVTEIGLGPSAQDHSRLPPVPKMPRRLAMLRRSGGSFPDHGATVRDHGIGRFSGVQFEPQIRGRGPPAMTVAF